MRTITCRNCDRSVEEADRLWDSILKLGTCPFCRSLYGVELDVVKSLRPPPRRTDAKQSAEPGEQWRGFLAAVQVKVTQELRPNRYETARIPVWRYFLSQ